MPPAKASPLQELSHKKYNRTDLPKEVGSIVFLSKPLRLRGLLSHVGRQITSQNVIAIIFFQNQSSTMSLK